MYTFRFLITGIVSGIVFLLIAARVHLAREHCAGSRSGATNDTELPAWARDTHSVQVFRPHSTTWTDTLASSHQGNVKDDRRDRTKAGVELIGGMPLEEYEMKGREGVQVERVANPEV